VLSPSSTCAGRHRTGDVLALLLFAGGALAGAPPHPARLRIEVEDSEFSGTMVQSVMVVYGLAVALIA